MDRAGEARRLAGIRARLDALDGAEWLLSAVDGAMLIDARGRDGSLITVATFSGHATQDEMELAAGAPDDLRFLLGLIDRAMRALRPARPAVPLPRPSDTAAAPKAAKNHAAEAAMLCERPAFRNWLIERHGLDLTGTADDTARATRAAARLRSLLGVTSRKEINENGAVRDRWIALRRDFYASTGRGQG